MSMRHVGGSKGGLKSLGGPLGLDEIPRTLQKGSSIVASIRHIGTSGNFVITEVEELRHRVSWQEIWGTMGIPGRERCRGRST